MNRRWSNVDSVFKWRYHPDLNWGVKVLQTLALPLGYGTMLEKIKGLNRTPTPSKQSERNTQGL